MISNRQVFNDHHAAGMIFCWQTFTTDWFINHGGLQLRSGKTRQNSGAMGVIFKRTFTINAVQQKQMAKNHLCSSPKLSRTDSVMFIHVHSFSMAECCTGQRMPMMELKPAPMYFNEDVFLSHWVHWSADFLTWVIPRREHGYHCSVMA